MKEPAGVSVPGTGLRPSTTLALAGLAVGLAGIVALLLALGHWYLALALLVAGPAFYVIHRYPWAAVMAWVALAPILMVGGGGIERRAYWLIHRALPVAVILVIVVARLIGVRKERLPRLGWPEAMMGGYLLLTIISIAFRSLDATATYIYMYDHVVVPMSIYLLVRLLAPKEQDLKKLVPALVFLLLFQSAVGALGWLAPGVLPDVWNNRESRATGSLRHPNVYAVAVLFAGLYLAHYGRQMRPGSRGRVTTAWLLGLSVVMAVVTMSRASWLAALAVAAALFFVYPKLSRRMVAVTVAAVLAFALVGGVTTTVADNLSARFYSDASEESALSRLPVMLASVRMIQERPLIGWGYENFDRYDHSFVRSIEGVYVPDKDHASHNFFLTLGAESGFLGLVLYLGPILWWLAKTPSGMRHLPTSGLRSRKFVVLLWVALGAQAIVYNFSNNRVAFGLGLWWLTIGLIASACDWRDSVTEEAESDLERQVAEIRSDLPTVGRLGR